MSQQPTERPDAPRLPERPQDGVAPKDSPRRFELPPYRVILHHDASLDLMCVVRAVMELMRFCRAEATNKMWQAHHCGRSLLLTTYKERAELYVDQFADRGVKVSIEPA
jgi:ATP-dependent Clp protease adapter protein ClpS